MRYEGHHPLFSDMLNRFLEARPSRSGLPKDILVKALSGYEHGNVTWLQVRKRETEIRRKLLSSMPEVLLATYRKRSLSSRTSAVALSIYHVNAAPLDTPETEGAPANRYSRRTLICLYFGDGGYGGCRHTIRLLPPDMYIGE
jgi:hypothetical protein